MKDYRLMVPIVVSVLLIVLIGIFRPREIDWTATFRSTDKIPYGSYILYQSLPKLFGDKKVSINEKQPYEFAYSVGRRKAFCFVQQHFVPSESNVDGLLHLAATGNDVFISASVIRGQLADSLQLKQKTSFDLPKMLKVFDNDTVDCLSSNFTNPQLHTDTGYWFKAQTFSFYYHVRDSNFLNQGFLTDSPGKDVTVLGTDGNGNPNFIAIHYGAGRILLHNNPYAFTNYYMLKPESAEYAGKCLSYLEGTEVVWDEYYKEGEAASDNASIRFVLSNEPLRWAYYCTLGGLFIFVLFNIKRRQRIIPVSDPYRNTSVEFARLVGALYYNQSDHKDIMVKKVNYLLEFIRNRYHLDTTVINDEFRDKLAAKTGIETDRIAHLFNLIHGVQQKTWLSKQELIELNNVISYFKTHSQ